VATESTAGSQPVEPHVEHRVFVKKIFIENFKSIEKLEIELKPGVNLLVGPNASGKTNILEAINFLYKALMEDAGKIPYAPHLPKYWSGRHLIYNMDPNRAVKLGLTIEHYLILDSKVYRQDIDFRVYFSYSVDTLIPTRYRIAVSTQNMPEHLVIDYSSSYIKIAIKESLVNLSMDILEGLVVSMLKQQLERVYRKVADEYVFESREDKYRRGSIMLLLDELRLPGILPAPLPTKQFIPFIILPEFERFDLEQILIISIAQAANGYRGIIIPKYPTLGFDLASIIEEVLRRIVFVRHPDIGALREPQPFRGETRLDERAVNLASVLLSLAGLRGGFPERVSRALRELFPGFSVKLKSEFGRVAIVAEEGGLELPPPNMPDGALKLLALLVAVESNPSILLVDELENSMHARMLEYIIDEFNSLDVPVLVATHSPIAVDLVAPDRVIVTLRDPVRCTYVERIEDPEKLKEELMKWGIALSDYVFYKLTYTRHEAQEGGSS